MKKFLQKSGQWLVMLCAMFAMSVSAMAQDYATVTSVSPVEGTYSLDERDYGFQYFNVKFVEKVAADFGTYTGQSLPEGFYFMDSKGNNVALASLQAWTDGDYINFSTSNAILEPETYTFHFPAGVIQFEGGKTNPELNFVWTLTAATKFEIKWNGVAAIGEQGDYAYKNLDGFVISAPTGVTFSSVSPTAKVEIQGERDEVTWEYSYTEVPATISLENGDVKVVFPQSYTEKGHYSFRLSDGAIVATDGKTSKELTFSASVDPNTYFDLSMNAVECESPLTSFDITLPEGLTAETVGESFKYSYYQDGNHEGSVTVTSHSQSDNVLTINFAEDVLPLDVWFTVEFEGGFVVATDGSISSSLRVINNQVTAPVFFAIGTSDPANGATLSLDNGTVSSVSFTTGESFAYIYDDNVPETITCKDAENNEVKVNTIVGWDYTLNFNFLSSIDKAGVYTLTIPAGSYQINGKNLPATTVTFTVTAKTHFGFNEWNVTPRTNGSYTSIESIVLPVPDGVTFADGTETVTISVNNVDEDVEATFDATEKTITLAWEAAEVGTYVVNIPEGTFTSTEGLKNNELGLGYEIIPTLALNELAVDAEGNYWTSFAFDYNYTLPEGYTPYKVVGISNTGTLSLEEIVGSPKTMEVKAYFYNYNNVEGASATIDEDYNVVCENLSNNGISVSVSGPVYEDGNYFDVYDGATLDIVSTDGAEIISVDVRSWDPISYRSENWNVQPIENGFRVTWSASSYLGGIVVNLATDEFNAPILPANAGILVKAAEASEGVEYKKTNSTATADMTGNLLVGCTESATWYETGKTYYKFSLDADNTEGSAGFYWGVDGGASIEAHAGKAYLVLDATPSSNSRYLINGVTTGIDAIATESTEAIFNLQGQRVVAPKAGVYVKNGKKIIVK